MFHRPVCCAVLCIVSLAAVATAREWNDSTGKFRVEGELVEIQGTRVKLKLTDGREIIVPIVRLSSEDQIYIALNPDKVPTIEQPAAPRPPRDNTKSSADKRAEKLMEEAYVLLKLDPKRNANSIDAKLRQAEALNPSNIHPAFIRGIYHLLVNCDPDQAFESFESCLKQEPDNVPVLCNAALARLKARSFYPALKHFEKAAELAPDFPALSQNLGRALRVHNDGRLQMPERLAAQYADLYSRLVAREDAPQAMPELGWLLVNIETDDAEEASRNDEFPDDVSGGGTGFVVHGDYLVTNRHVVKGATVVKIRIPTTKRTLDAKIVALSDEADVAIIHCPGLSLPSVRLASAIPRRASDVMVLGLPQFSQLGATIKSTRGSVTALPNEATENMLLIDAEMNSGNSGGPVANKRGQVVAIATAVFAASGGTGGRYGAGIPVAEQLPFLKRHIPQLRAAQDAGEEQSWPDVDEQISRSTVLVLVGRPESKSASSDQFAGLILDPTCPACSGSKEITKLRRKQPCPHCRGIGLDRDVALALLAYRQSLADAAENAEPLFDDEPYEDNFGDEPDVDNHGDSPSVFDDDAPSIFDSGEPFEDASIDLLALVDVRRDSAVGTWRSVEGEIVAPRVSSARLQIPCIPPREYDLDVVVSCGEAPLDGIIGIVAAGRQTSLVLEGFNDLGASYSGLESINGRRVPENETGRKGRFSRPGEKMHVRCVVRDEGIQISVNGQFLTEYDGDPRLITGAPTAGVRDGRALYLGANFRAIVFHSVKITPVTGKAKMISP